AQEMARDVFRRGWVFFWRRVHQQESGIPYHIWVEVLRRAFASTRTRFTPAVGIPFVGTPSIGTPFRNPSAPSEQLHPDWPHDWQATTVDTVLPTQLHAL